MKSNKQIIVEYVLIIVLSTIMSLIIEKLKSFLVSIIGTKNEIDFFFTFILSGFVVILSINIVDLLQNKK